MEKKQTVFKKVMVSDIHIGQWMFYITPTGFKGYGLIERPSVIQGLYRCNNTYASQVLEEIELPSDDEVFNELTHEVYLSKTLQESTKAIYKFAVSKTTGYILNKLK